MKTRVLHVYKELYFSHRWSSDDPVTTLQTTN